ncbi:hypothetical protein PMAYCL1PPCAC_03637, partial [Pristionchus mayeri]
VESSSRATPGGVEKSLKIEASGGDTVKNGNATITTSHSYSFSGFSSANCTCSEDGESEAKPLSKALRLKSGSKSTAVREKRCCCCCQPCCCCRPCCCCNNCCNKCCNNRCCNCGQCCYIKKIIVVKKMCCNRQCCFNNNRCCNCCNRNNCCCCRPCCCCQPCCCCRPCCGGKKRRKKCILPTDWIQKMYTVGEVSTIPNGVEPTRSASTKTFKSVRELKSSNPSVAFSHYDSKYKCCCGSVHVKQGALLIALIGIIICIFDLISLIISTQSTVVSVILQLLCSILVIVGIQKRIAWLVLPNVFLLLAASICLIVGAFLFLWAAIDPVSIAGRYIKNILEAEQFQDAEELVQNEKFGNMMAKLVAVFMTILFFLMAILTLWWLKVNYTCYRYLHDSSSSRNDTSVKFTKDPVERV